MALITYVTRVQFDFGALSLLAEELELAGIRRPLLVTDKGIVAAGLLDRVRNALPARLPLAVFDETPPNPTEAAVRAAVSAYRAHEADGIIGLGGGSPLDLAKAVAVAATHPGGALKQYAVIEGGLNRITAAVAPSIAIPTTSGTGSEVSRGAIIVLDDGRKVSIGSPYLLPKAAICDPELTFGLPPLLTAATGMDAITHCIEAYLSPRVNPVADAIGLDGLARGWRHIQRATTDGSDRTARWEMMMASMEGAMAFQKGLGAVHALAHPLGGLPAPPVLHHGTLNAVLLPHVLRFNAATVPERISTLGIAMGLEDTRPEAVADAIATLAARLGLPASLGAMGVPRAVLPAMAAAAMRDHCHPTNPREASEADYLALLEAAYAG